YREKNLFHELTDFDKGQIVGAHAAGLSVEEIAKLCDVSNEAVFEVLSMYNIPINNVSAEKNSEQRAKKRKRQKIADVNGRAASEKPTSEIPVTESTVQTTAPVTPISDYPDSDVNMQKQDSHQGGANDTPVLEIPDPETPFTETPDSEINI
uniref:Uncharacterized protein n=1 Tax=Sphaeramia orbicularis TaxID=375764 RepID=A0A673ADJ6_9TELE